MASRLERMVDRPSDAWESRGAAQREEVLGTRRKGTWLWGSGNLLLKPLSLLTHLRAGQNVAIRSGWLWAVGCARTPGRVSCSALDPCRSWRHTE